MRRSLLILMVLVAAASPAAAANRKMQGKPIVLAPARIAAAPLTSADHNVNEILTTISDAGGYGYFDPSTAIISGQGFSFNGAPSALFHAGLILGTSPTAVSDAAFGSDDQGATRPYNFVSTKSITTGSTPSIGQYTCARFNDADFDATPLGVEVSQQTYAWAGDSYIIIDITINASNALNGLYVALFADWDIGADLLNNDVVTFDAARRLSIMNDTGGLTQVYGIQLLSHPLSGARAVQNQIYVYPNIADPSIDPGFEDSDKYAFFTDMTVTMDPHPDDLSHMVAAGPFNVAANGSVRVAFAMLAGDSQADLASQADQAQARWNAGITRPCATTTGVPDELAPIGARLAQNHPNPFTRSTTIEYALDAPASVRLRVFDITGRVVRELVNGPQTAATHRVMWDGRDATGKELSGGVYFCELVGPGIRTSRRIVLGR